MADRPQRVQLSRQAGFRLQEIYPGAVIVARPGPWGNPFRVADMTWLAVGLGFRADLAGRTAAAVELYRRWLRLEHREGPLHGSATGGDLEFANGQTVSMQEHVEGLALGFHVMLHGETLKVPAAPSLDHIRAELRGRALACWCKLGTPCHGDVLLEIANG